MRKVRFLVYFIVFALVVGAALKYRFGRSLWRPVHLRVRGRRTAADVVEAYGAGARMESHFRAANVPYPPERVAFLAFKKEKRLELWARKDDAWVFIRSYPILAASGHAGPKLREGDRQVPEGVYRIEALNPNSSYHLSMKLNYPNEYDWEKARQEGRAHPGSDIFIHGKALSIGCLAMGDEAIEELFCLIGLVWPTEVKVLIAPNDLRCGRPAESGASNPSWVGELYEALRRELAPFTIRPSVDTSY